MLTALKPYHSPHALSTKGKVAAMFVYYNTLISNTHLTSFQIQLLEDTQPLWWCSLCDHQVTGCELTCVSHEHKLKANFE
jgi:hypothetical protein